MEEIGDKQLSEKDSCTLIEELDALLKVAPTQETLSQKPANQTMEEVGDKQSSEKDSCTLSEEVEVLPEVAPTQETLSRKPVEKPEENEIVELDYELSPENDICSEEEEDLAADAPTQETPPHRHPDVWLGYLHLKEYKNEIFVKFISGDVAVAKAALPSLAADCPDPNIYIKHKLRFEKVPQRLIKNIMKAESGSCVMLALSSERNKVDKGIFKHSCVEYFLEKRAVGVVEFPQEATVASKYKMFIFPPSDFVRRNLSKISPTFTRQLYESSEPHLLLVTSTFGTCPESDRILNTYKKNIQ